MLAANVSSISKKISLILPHSMTPGHRCLASRLQALSTSDEANATT
jgi:hypothetical protein